MKLLVFGQTGQVATELSRRLPDGTDAEFLGRKAADLNTPEACAAAISESSAQAVINAAAWTGVDLAETQEAEATRVNGEAPGAMARACAAKGIPFLHISTDYVFDGEGDGPFSPDSKTAPISAYGRSKLAGETAIGESGAQFLILRTSWVVSAHGSNFVKTMLRLGKEREVLRVVADQMGGPTPAAGIADALLVAAGAMTVNRGLGGIHHFSGAPDISWADFARAIFEHAGLKCRVEDIPSSAYPTPAARPLNSRLDCSSFEAAFGVQKPDWRAGLADIIRELGAET